MGIRWRVDGTLAVAFAVVGFLTAETSDALAASLILLATLPYVAWRRAPFAVLLVTAAAVTTLMVRGDDSGALTYAVAFGAYNVGARCDVRRIGIAAVALGACLVALALSGPDFVKVADLIAVGAVFGTALSVGWAMQTRGRAQELAAHRAAADERLRIAQEVHDVVAHSLGVIAVQAGVGLHVLDTDPDEARRALTHISRTSRSSLTEIRQLLGVIRSGEASYVPAPGLGDLAELAREVDSAGLAVDLQVGGPVDEVPAGVGLAAYRIVQEALTNALRHARARTATVRLDADEGRLHLQVDDDGQGSDDSRSGGHGLVGMRERAAVYGGTLEAGPGPSGGFRVSADLPYGEGAES